MKKKLLFTLFLFVTSIGFGQNTHTLTAYDNYFDPDTLYILAGDTVNFVSLGYHSATEVDSMDWVNNVAQHNGGFYVGQGAPTNDMKFTINTIGVYYNICVPHANMGMKSIIIVGSQTTSLVEQNQLKNIIYPNPASTILSIHNSASVKIYDMNGKLVLEQVSISNKEDIDISSLRKGMYTVVLDQGSQKLLIE